MLRRAFFSSFVVLSLAGCMQTARAPVTDGVFPAQPDVSRTPHSNTILDHQQSAGILREPVRVAILAPMSGSNAALGDALAQAAQLAVFDLNETHFQLVPKDTGGTPEGARRAVEEAAREGARLIIGPLFAPEVEAAKTAARSYGLNVIGFSTDWRIAGDNLFTMGVLPFEQAQRMADFAASKGLRNVGVVMTSDAYGEAVYGAFSTALARHGITPIKVARVRADGGDATTAVQALIDGGATYDAMFLPLGGAALAKTVSALSGYGLPSGKVTYLGTGLWDDGDASRNPALLGAYYAAPSPQVREAFERNYQRIYGVKPPRLASIGYDAAALAIVLARASSAQQNGRVTYDRGRLLDASGFSGVDGIFRFKPDGRVERGLAVLQITHGGQVMVVDGAPQSFVGRAH